MNKVLLYDLLISIAEDIIQKYNPCLLDQDGGCVKSRALGDINRCCGHFFELDDTTKCEHLEPEIGCTINCLACKISFCQHALDNMPGNVSSLLERLLRLAIRSGIYDLRSDRSVTLNIIA